MLIGESNKWFFLKLVIQKQNWPLSKQQLIVRWHRSRKSNLHNKKSWKETDYQVPKYQQTLWPDTEHSSWRLNRAKSKWSEPTWWQNDGRSLQPKTFYPLFRIQPIEAGAIGKDWDLWSRLLILFLNCPLNCLTVSIKAKDGRSDSASLLINWGQIPATKIMRM